MSGGGAVRAVAGRTTTEADRSSDGQSAAQTDTAETDRGETIRARARAWAEPLCLPSLFTAALTPMVRMPARQVSVT